MRAAVEAARERIAAEEGVTAAARRVWAIEPVAFDETLVKHADDAARAVTGHDAPHLFSGALHDAASVARAGVPAAMLFVQSARGISHARDEDSRPEHIEAGVRTLARLATRAIE
jgi:N-carbamoyl-L-amino-acid hydrolase